MKRLSAGVAAMVFFCTFATSAQSEEVTIGEHSVNIPQDLSQESQNLVKQYLITHYLQPLSICHKICYLL